MPVPEEVKQQLGEADPEATQVIESEALSNGPGQQSSILETLRAKRKEAEGGRTVDIPVPGYSGMLIARYRVLDAREMRAIGTKIQRTIKDESDRQLHGIIDTLLKACEGLYFKDPESGELTAIDPDETGIPVLYDSRLAEAMGFKTETARETLLALFNSEEPAIIGHGMRLDRWYRDTSADVNDVFLGE